MLRYILLLGCALLLLLPATVPAEEPAAESELLFQDDFNDEFLSDDWEILNLDEDSMIIEEGHLQILTNVAQDSFFNPVNLVLLKRELSGQYEIVLTMKYSRTGSAHDWTQNQFAGLMLYKDDQNGIVLAASNAYGYEQWGHDAIHFSKMRAGEWLPDYSYNLGDTIRDRKITLRIQRIKRKFIASHLNNEGEWQTIGEYTELRPDYRVGIFAARGNSAHEELEKFDLFSLRNIN